MKIYVLSASIILSAFISNAQAVQETVSINPGYTHQTYYSLANGAFPAVSNTDWDLGFQIRGFAASIIINSKNNVHLYNSGKSAADWATMTAADTTGILNSGYELFNSDTTWDYGAFNQGIDTANAFDLGWGVYDFATHIVGGDSIYFIKLNNSVVKKLWIESLTTGTYYFRWADVDGSNEITASLNKSAFSTRFFGYYSIQNNMSLDREPDYNAWDLTFTQYITLTPFIYLVSGVLSNDSVFAAKAYPVDINTVTPSGYTLSPNINVIGYDWKTFNNQTFMYDIADSTVYFVKDRNAGVWKMIFNGFGGSANGNFMFTKEFLGVTGIADNDFNPLLSAYPNPASDYINIVVANEHAGETAIVITNSIGQVVKSDVVSLTNDIETVLTDVHDLSPGIYHVAIRQGNKIGHKAFVVN